jgi:hypothetical protein
MRAVKRITAPFTPLHRVALFETGSLRKRIALPFESEGRRSPTNLVRLARLKTNSSLSKRFPLGRAHSPRHFFAPRFQTSSVFLAGDLPLEKTFCATSTDSRVGALTADWDHGMKRDARRVRFNASSGKR